jgi:hypothetical protein
VPRLTFDRIRENWKKTSQEIPVPAKKEVFFRLMAPLVLIANEKILKTRQLASEIDLADPQLIVLAVKYKILPDTVTSLEEKQRPRQDRHTTTFIGVGTGRRRKWLG